MHRPRRGAVRERHTARPGRVQEARQAEAMAEAVRQHLRYADRRKSPGARGQPAGSSTPCNCSWPPAASGPCSARSPAVRSTTRPGVTLTRSRGKSWRSGSRRKSPAVTAQDILAGTVLHPHRLLDIVRNYVTFMQTDDGKTIKAAPRYQQYRAVCKAIERLTAGKTREAGRPPGPPWRHRLAHPGLGQEPDDGVPRPQAAFHPRPAVEQGRCGHRQDPAPGPAQRDDEAIRRVRRGGEQDQPGQGQAEPARPWGRLRHDPEAAGRRGRQGQGRPTTWPTPTLRPRRISAS